METQASKYSSEALAFITLYKTMAPNIQKEVKNLIVTELDDEANQFTAISFAAWDAENSQIEEESAIWEKFSNAQKGV